MKRASEIVFAILVVTYLPFMNLTAQAAQKTYTNSIGMEFILIPAGDSIRKMPDTRNVFDEVTPGKAVTITISEPYYLGKYEVTQEQWYAIMGSNPAKFKGRHNPMERISWNDIQNFIRTLNEKEGHNRYRLPTEAEWEHAARAGTSTKWFFGTNEDTFGEYSWHKDNSGRKTHPVGQKKPNPWGLYDIYGNVSELVHDWYEKYPENNQIDPSGPPSGSERIVRGGNWFVIPGICNSEHRVGRKPDSRNDADVGFRLLLPLDR